MQSRSRNFSLHLNLCHGKQLDGQFVALLPERVIRSLKISAEGSVSDDDPRKPLDGGHSIPARYTPRSGKPCEWDNGSPFMLYARITSGINAFASGKLRA